MSGLKTEFLCELSADLEPPQAVGGPSGRQIYIVTGGAFEGPRMRGELLPGGGDWLIQRSDGAGELDVRATLRTHDGALIYAHYPGVIVLPPEARAALGRGEQVGPDGIYFRTTPRFETGAAAYAWLNTTVAVGVGAAAPNRVMYRIYAVL